MNDLTIFSHLKNVIEQVPLPLRDCLENTTACHLSCERTMLHCLEMGGDHADPFHIRLLRDCSEICATTADFLMRGSVLHPYTCGACAEACMLCAEDCERIGSHDPVMRACADLCRRCAESCRRMAIPMRAAA